MKVLVAIISGTLTREVTDCLEEGGYQFTKMATSGAFYQKGNSTLLIGLTENELEECISVIRETISLSQHKSDKPGVYDANIFVVPMESLKNM